mmetsp:Transcript_201/g.251  ORF Transcript_201/g.251 Transcript_201/m.251 type:complete len:139 (-) Transcript_201:435-851(-)
MEEESHSTSTGKEISLSLEQYDDKETSSRQEGSTARMNSQQFRRTDRSEANFRVHAHVQDKIIPLNCGRGGQTLLWAGNVAITRWDEVKFEGWKSLGVPTSVFRIDGEPLELSDQICSVCEDGEHITFTTSMDPFQPK